METAMMNVTINERTTPIHDRTTPHERSTPPVYDRTGSMVKLEAPSQDQPIDFSTKVKEVRELNEELLRKMSADSAIGMTGDKSPAPSHLIGEPRVSMPGINSFLPPVSMAASMGMLGMGVPGMFPSGFMPPGFNPIWTNHMAAMMQQQQEMTRKILQNAAANHAAKQSAVRAPLLKPGTLPGALPGMPQFPGMTPGGMVPNIPDPGILAEALKSHEEMFSLYKQQVMSQKAAEDAKKGTSRRTGVANGNHSTQSPKPSTQLPPTKSDQTSASHDQPSTTCTPFTSQSELIHQNGSSGSIKEETAEMEVTSNGRTHNDSGSSSSEDCHSSMISAGREEVSAPHQISSEENSEDQRSSASVYSNGDLNEVNAMRPRSSTLPTQQTEHSSSTACSPAPSQLSVNIGPYSSPGTPNKGSFRKRARTLPEDQKVRLPRDEAYWERRRKNNEAAKRSRDSRRAKEDEIAIRAAFLEQENLRLRVELAALRQQTAKLRSELVIYQSPDDQSEPADSQT